VERPAADATARGVGSAAEGCTSRPLLHVDDAADALRDDEERAHDERVRIVVVSWEPPPVRGSRVGA
jgi:hypothetical protein